MKIIGRREISGPNEPIVKVAYSPCGSMIVGGGGFMNEPTTISVWDAMTLARRASFHSSDQSIGILRFLPDGRTLLSSGYIADGIEAWDVVAERKLTRLRILPDPYRKSIAGHLLTATHVGDVAISADGKLVALGCWDCTLKIVTWATGEILELPHKNANVDFVTFAHGEQRLIAGTYERLFEWEVTDWTLRRTVPSDSLEHWTHHAIDGGTRVVSLSHQGRIVIWKLDDWTSEESQIRYKGPPTCLAYSPRDGLLAIGQKTGTALFWDTNRRKLTGRLKLSDDFLNSLAFAPDRPAISLAVSPRDGPHLVEFEYRV